MDEYIFTKSDAEIDEFMDNSAEVIRKVCRNLRLDEKDSRLVRENLRLIFAFGKIEYDPTKDAMANPHIQAIAKDIAHYIQHQRHSECFIGSRCDWADSLDYDDFAA